MRTAASGHSVYASAQTAHLTRRIIGALMNGPQAIDMNRDRLEGKWKQLGGKAKEQWGRLTHDPQREFAGRHDQLAGRMQERHGISTEESASQLKEFMARNRNWKIANR